MLRIPGLLLACVLPLAVLLLGRAVPATADDDYSITIIQSNREGTGGFSWDLTSDVDGIIVDSTPFPTLTLEQGAVVRFVGVVEDSHSFEVQAKNVKGVESGAVLVGPTEVANGAEISYSYTWTVRAVTSLRLRGAM